MANQPPRVPCADEGVFDVIEDALQSLWQTANELSRIEPPRAERYRVTIFGSARLESGQPLYEDVKGMAAHLSSIGCDIVTGGGPGLMQAANEGSQLGDPDDVRESVGVRVELPFEQGANPFVEKLYTHKTFFTRLHHFARLSEAFVIMGGGIGTTLETLMIWQLLQVRHLNDVPLIFVGEMWTDLVAWAQKHMLASDPPLANARDVDIPICVATVQEACALIEQRVARW